MGVGRNKTSDPVCGDAGIILHKTSGSYVNKGDVIMEIFGKDEASLEPAKKQLEEAVAYSDAQPERKPLVYKIIQGRL